jgi:PAS domain-containing protein
VVLVFHDQSSEVAAQQALRRSEAYIKTVLDHLPIGIAVNSVNPSVTFHYMNDNFPAFYRTTREKLADLDAFWDAVYEDQSFRDSMRKRVLEDCASGIAERMCWDNIPITRKGQPTSFIKARNIALPDRGLMISTVSDVTERNQNEESLRRRAEEVESLLEVVPAAVLVASDPQCLKVMGNRRANELYEVKEKENLSVGALLKVRRYFTPEGRELLPSELPLRLASATNQDVRDKEFSMLLPSGKRMTILGSAVPLRDDQNQVRGSDSTSYASLICLNLSSADLSLGFTSG